MRGERREVRGERCEAEMDVEAETEAQGER